MFVDREGALSLEPREWEEKRQEIRSAKKAEDRLVRLYGSR